MSKRIQFRQLGSYPKALRRLKRTGELKDTVRHRTSKYLNNRIEADHGALKRLIHPARGFQSMKTAYAAIKGFEMMRMIRRRHCILIEPSVLHQGCETSGCIVHAA